MRTLKCIFFLVAGVMWFSLAYEMLAITPQRLAFAATFACVLTGWEMLMVAAKTAFEEEVTDDNTVK